MNADTELLAHARLLGGHVAGRFASVSADDVAQEIVLYVLTHRKVLDEWNDYCLGDFANQEEEKLASKRINTIFRRAGARYARKEVAAMVGYRPEDEAFYSLGLLRVLVEALYADGLSERPPVGRSESVAKTNADPAVGGNYLVSLLDVQRGIEHLPAKYRNRLKFRFTDKNLVGATDAEIARMVENLAVAPGLRQRIEKHLGTSEDQIRSRIRTSLAKLQSKLGGASPYVKDHHNQESEAAMI